jgi:ABC-2 type transport system permease protein
VTGVDFTLVDSMAAILNCLPLVVLSVGLAVGVHGFRPAWVVPVAGGAVVVLYLLSFLGPAVNAPEWLIDVSPWAHVAVAPPDPVNWAGTVVMVLIGVVFGAAGFVGYARRDLQ